MTTVTTVCMLSLLSGSRTWLQAFGNMRHQQPFPERSAVTQSHNTHLSLATKPHKRCLSSRLNPQRSRANLMQDTINQQAHQQTTCAPAGDAAQRAHTKKNASCAQSQVWCPGSGALWRPQPGLPGISWPLKTRMRPFQDTQMARQVALNAQLIAAAEPPVAWLPHVPTCALTGSNSEIGIEATQGGVDGTSACACNKFAGDNAGGSY